MPRKKTSGTDDQGLAPPTIVSIYEAKTHFSRLIMRVIGGEEIVVSRSGRPVARLVPYAPLPAQRVLGLDEGRVEIAPDFDAPLPEDLIQEFET